MALSDINIADTIYNYIPSRSVTAIFVTLFSISTILHIWQSVRSRIWWLLPTVCIAGAAETLGWSGRLWASFDPLSNIAFQIQICCTIMGPTPLVAASFLILGRVISRLGHQYSRMSAMSYSILFVTCDVISLIIQAIGGGTASAADSIEGANKGGNIMLGGIAFQLAVITCYILFATEYMIRYSTDRPVTDRFQIKPKRDPVDAERKPDIDNTANSEPNSLSSQFRPGVLTRKLTILLFALVLEAVFLYIRHRPYTLSYPIFADYQHRAVYRTIELVDGWEGEIISTEVYFNIFDGAMIVLAMYTLNFLHPSWLLDEARQPANDMDTRDS